MFDENDVIEEQIQNEQPTEEQAENAGKPSPQESFRQIREAKEKAQRERDEFARYAEQLERQLQAKERPQEDEDTTPDDRIVEQRDFKKLKKRLDQTEKELDEQKKRSELSLTEERLRKKYPDLDSVITSENILRLKELDPEAAEAIGRTTDYYTKMYLAYKSISDINSNSDMSLQDRALAMKNMAKPKVLAALSPQQGESPMSKANAFANGLTPELAEQLRKEMYAAMKNH